MCSSDLWDGAPVAGLRLPLFPGAVSDVIGELDNLDIGGQEAADLDGEPDGWGKWAIELHAFAVKHHADLGLEAHSKELPIRVSGMHPTVRIRANGRPTIDIVGRFTQRPKASGEGEDVPVAGCTIVADTNGNIRHLIKKAAKAPEERVAAMRAIDGGDAYRERNGKGRLRVRFSNLHSPVREDNS